MRGLILACMLLLPTSTAAADRLTDTAGKRIQKPSLYLYTAADWCEPCKRLQADLDGDRDFKAALLEKYVLRVYDFDEYRSYATRAGVKGLPSFFTANAHWEGYEGKEDLARRLGLNWQPSAPPAAANPAAVLPVAPPPAASSSNDAALNAAYERWGDQERKLEQLRKRLEASERNQASLIEKARKAARDAAAAVTPAADPADDSGGSGWGALIAWGASQLGWTLGPIGGAATTILVPMVWRYLTRRRPRRATDRPRDEEVEAGEEERPIVVTTPPPPQVVRTKERVTVVEGPNNEATAYRDAIAELRENEPGLRPLMERLINLKDQFLSGNPPRRKV